MVRSSFSQHNLFSKCRRWWYLQYVKKLPAPQDLTYAFGGKVLHDCLQKWYDGDISSIDKLKEFFTKAWENKDLHNSKIKLKKDTYWLMVLNGTQVGRYITSTELKIFYPEVVAYLDAVNTKDDEIIDWKSSTRSKENEEEYKKQLQVYAWLYNRKFGRLPKNNTVYYLKYNGSKSELSVVFTEDDIKEIEKWYFDIMQEMDFIKEKNMLPPTCDSCSPWCPYESYCKSDETSLKYNLHLMGNYIMLEGPLSSLLHKGLSKKFSYELKNAYFIKKANPHARTTINFWNLQKQMLPIGFLKGLLKTLDDYGKYRKCKTEISYTEHRAFNENKIQMPEKFLNGIKLRDYQLEAVEEFLKDKIAILEIGTGGGKTEIAIECIRRLGIKTLFIVDKVELLRQTKKRLEDALGIKIGQIGHGEEDIQDITVATVQTLNKRRHEYLDYLKTVRFAIFDETHKVAAQTYFSLGNSMTNTEYRLGISGTAYRDDGNDMMINATVGYKCFDLSSKILIEKGWLVKPKIIFIKDYMTKDEVKQLEIHCKQGLINERPNYTNYYNMFISTNLWRNNVIYNLINDKYKGRTVLILTKLIDHGQLLEQMIPGSKHLYGATNKKERKQIFDTFVNGDLNILISTLSIFAEGIDIPALDVVINAGANKGNVKTIQVLGRVLRKMAGKKNAEYVDFMDETKFFRLASLARKKALMKEGHDVDIIENGGEKK